MTKKSSKYEKDYVEADRYVVVNDDPDLNKIILSLPKAPPMHLIDGYGLPINEQRFRRITIPHKLIALEKEALEKTRNHIGDDNQRGSAVTLLKIQKEYWKLLKQRRKELRKEIDFIRTMWWHRLNGFWFFNRGKPTWITGRHFYYLNFFHLDTKSGYPDYRDCDRREYVFMEYCWTTTETFARTDKDGYALKEEDGTYKMIDLGRRVCLGSAQSKNRRRGNTSKAISDGMEVTTRTIGSDGFGIQSYSEENAKAHFKGKVMPAWDALPIFLKPYSTSGRVADTLKLDVAKNDYGIKGLQTQIVYATTSSPKAFDGKKKVCLLTDEEGKELVGGSVSKRWEVNRHTLAQGDGMVVTGFSYHPSTVDQLAAGAFDYHYLVSSSNFYRRIPVKGQTISGLLRIFIPAQDGLEGYIDSHGYSVTGEVKDYQKKEGFKQTAEEYLSGERNLLIEDGTPEAMQKLREHKKLFPMRFSDSWLGEAGSIGFDMELIDKALARIRREDNTVRGNLEWVNGAFGGDVIFVEDEEKGLFIVSKQVPENVSNKKTRVKVFNTFEGGMTEAWRPMYPETFVIGVDTFRFANKQESKISASKGKADRVSDGGIAMLWNYDASIDGDKPRSQWESYRFVVTFRNRMPNTDAFNEEVLKLAIWSGGMVFPETNIENTYEYFVRNGFGGYLLYGSDAHTGRLKPKPGIASLEGSKQELFNLTRDYIAYRSEKEEHKDLLQEWKEISDISQMRYYDLLAAAGMALIGAKSPYVSQVKRIEDQDYDVSDFIIW